MMLSVNKMAAVHIEGRDTAAAPADNMKVEEKDVIAALAEISRVEERGTAVVLADNQMVVITTTPTGGIDNNKMK